MPARERRTCDGVSASAGASRAVGMRVSAQRWIVPWREVVWCSVVIGGECRDARRVPLPACSEAGSALERWEDAVRPRFTTPFRADGKWHPAGLLSVDWGNGTSNESDGVRAVRNWASVRRDEEVP